MPWGEPLHPRLIAAIVAALVLLASACTATAEDGAVVEEPPPATPSAAPPTEMPTTGSHAGGEGLVRIELGAEWQDVVDAHPPGTTFVVAAGEHRGATVVLRDGDRLMGEDGAVMNGGIVLQEWTRLDGEEPRWVAEGLELDTEVFGETDPGWEHVGARHELLIEGERLIPVDTEENLRPGFYWLDLEAGRVVAADDPTGALAELSYTETAISGVGSHGVTISNLEVKHYATRAQGAAIDADVTTDWTITGVDVHHNHAGGIRVDQGSHVFNSRVHANGQVGINGAQEDLGHSRPITIIANEVTGNTALRFLWFWETGGIKLTWAEGAVVHENLVADNNGPGIWYDLDCFDGVITNNVVRNNSAVGILYEISTGGTISRNEVTGNGFGIGEQYAAGISLSNSGDTTITHNTLSGNTNEVTMVAAPREDFGFTVAGNLIADNDITLEGGFVGLSVVTDEPELYDPEVNQFHTNRYVLRDCEPCFFWDERITTEAWLSIGNDTDSEILIDEGGSS